MRWCLSLAALILAGAACGGADDDEGDAGGTASVTTTAQTTETAPTTSETTTEAEPQGPHQIRIAYREGKLSGDTGTVRVRRGERVQLTVRADVEDEVHVHGYDLFTGVAPGHAARISFEADQRGTFTVELEHLQLPIAKLRVDQ